jgi:hypothetical protein
MFEDLVEPLEPAQGLVVEKDGAREERKGMSLEADGFGGLLQDLSCGVDGSEVAASLDGGPVGVDLSGMDDEEAPGRVRVMDAAVEQLACAAVDEAELVLVVPMRRHAARDLDAALQLDPLKARCAPDSDVVGQAR